MYLAPEAVETAHPSLRGHIPVPLVGHNLLPAFINDHYCEIFVDCGTTSALMKHRAAKRLGLLQQATRSKLVQLRLWAREVRVVVQVVEAVNVELTCGVSFPCTFLVAPEQGPINSLRSEIFLDNATLCNTRAVLRISPTHSTLFFPTPVPKWTARVGPDAHYELDNARLRNTPDADRLRVHIDTGARFFYAADKYPTATVHLVVAEGVELFGGILKTAPSTPFDFILGTKPLARYNCILDFANQHLYFYAENGRVYRSHLTKTAV